MVFEVGHLVIILSTRSEVEGSREKVEELEEESKEAKRWYSFLLFATRIVGDYNSGGFLEQALHGWFGLHYGRSNDWPY